MRCVSGADLLLKMKELRKMRQKQEDALKHMRKKHLAELEAIEKQQQIQMEVMKKHQEHAESTKVRNDRAVRYQCQFDASC